MVDNLIERSRHACRLSRPDNRDWDYSIRQQPLREMVDLREWDGRIEDQKDLGSCVGHAISGAYELMLKRDYPDRYQELSSLYVYYNARINERLTELDAGATIRAGLRGVRDYGICTEELWPYDPTKFDVRPSVEAYEDGRRRTLENYRRLYTTDQIVRALNNNRPVVVGMNVYTQFFDLNEENSTVELPTNRVAEYYGEHAVYLVGYDQAKKEFLAKNSFGPNWGDDGYFYMPYDYAKAEVFESWIFDIVLRT